MKIFFLFSLVMMTAPTQSALAKEAPQISAGLSSTVIKVGACKLLSKEPRVTGNETGCKIKVSLLVASCNETAPNDFKKIEKLKNYEATEHQSGQGGCLDHDNYSIALAKANADCEGERTKLLFLSEDEKNTECNSHENNIPQRTLSSTDS